jgi:cyanophycin synthetase
MAQSGDLLLIFADALARTWKQITKFQPAGEAPRPIARIEIPLPLAATDEAAFTTLQGVVRDERGLVFEREQND